MRGADVLGELLSNRAHRTVELTGDGCPAMAIVNGLTRISAANPSVKLSVVDHDGVQVRWLRSSILLCAARTRPASERVLPF